MPLALIDLVKEAEEIYTTMEKSRSASSIPFVPTLKSWVYTDKAPHLSEITTKYAEDSSAENLDERIIALGKIESQFCFKNLAKVLSVCVQMRQSKEEKPEQVYKEAITSYRACRSEFTNKAIAPEHIDFVRDCMDKFLPKVEDFLLQERDERCARVSAQEEEAKRMARNAAKIDMMTQTPDESILQKETLAKVEKELTSKIQILEKEKGDLKEKINKLEKDRDEAAVAHKKSIEITEQALKDTKKMYEGVNQRVTKQLEDNRSDSEARIKDLRKTLSIYASELAEFKQVKEAELRSRQALATAKEQAKELQSEIENLKAKLSESEKPLTFQRKPAPPSGEVPPHVLARQRLGQFGFSNIRPNNSSSSSSSSNGPYTSALSMLTSSKI